MSNRASGIIVKDRKILLMRRFNNGEEYYVFPGGGIEENENPEEALKREIKEETSLDISDPELLFEYKNQLRDQYEFYFLIRHFSGLPELGNGPERDIANGQNQYFLEWIDIADVIETRNITTLYPKEAVKKLAAFHL